ncbi:MAG TPA: amidase family protein, partial [Geminicoccaceae bacterium]|nr:amidase family protein [Geminicoccaceae bacterium]
RHGVLAQSPMLDHVGTFANHLADLALLTEPLIGFDARDQGTRPTARPDLRATLEADWPLAPNFAFVRTPVWERAEEDTRAAFAELVEALGERVREVALPEAFADAHRCHGVIMEADIALSFAPLYERGRDQLSDTLRGIIERGQGHRALDYLEAKRRARHLAALLEPIFEQHDAILTPAAPGTAPVGLAATGSPIFCTIWTLLGMPAVTLPLLEGANGLPMGVQLVGARGDDARLLRHARWLLRRLGGNEEES